MLDRGREQKPEYELRTITSALCTCHRVMQKNAPLDPHVRAAMHVMFQHLGRRWLNHMHTGSHGSLKSFTSFLVAHSRTDVRLVLPAAATPTTAAQHAAEKQTQLRGCFLDRNQWFSSK